jgi:hypothetical protein
VNVPSAWQPTLPYTGGFGGIVFEPANAEKGDTITANIATNKNNFFILLLLKSLTTE